MPYPSATRETKCSQFRHIFENHASYSYFGTCEQRNEVQDYEFETLDKALVIKTKGQVSPELAGGSMGYPRGN